MSLRWYLRETAKQPPNDTTLRAIGRVSISGTFVTAKSGDKAASWPGPAPPASGRGAEVDVPGGQVPVVLASVHRLDDIDPR